MLSILIPTYNYNVYPLAKEIEKQALKTNIVFELICVDDGSFSTFNSENQNINTLTNCLFIENKKNIGRSANRQLLAKKAQYDWLLFIDSDVIPKHSSFINTYLEHISNSNFDAVFGGFAYHKDSYKANSSLRYTFGKKREEVPAIEREKKPYKVIISANMLIKKKIYLELVKTETQNLYGLDYLLGSMLKQNKTKVKHIDNEVYHYGLDDNKEFLNKTKKAIESLSYLVKNKKIKSNQISILKAFKLLKTVGLNGLFGKILKSKSKSIESNLLSEKPNLLLLDLYKLGYLCRIHK